MTAPQARADDFIRGDVNSDFAINLGDVNLLVDSFRELGPELPCRDAADVTDDGIISFDRIPGVPGGDADRLMEWLVAIGPTAGTPLLLPPPFPRAGADPSMDNLACDQGPTRPGDVSDPRFHIAWLAAENLFRGQRDVELFVKADTPRAVEAFSLAYLVNTAVLEIQGVDLGGTAFPASERPGFEASPVFRWRLKASAERNYSLLLVVAVFVGEDFALIPFPLTQGPVADLKLLRVIANVRDDAPLGRVAALAPFLGRYAADIADLGGTRTDFSSGGEPGYIPQDPSSLEGHMPIIDAGEIIFLRGDSNADANVNIGDPVYTLGFLFLGGPDPIVKDSADANDDGQLNIADPVFTLSFLFLGGATILPPFPGCGGDPTDSDPFITGSTQVHCDSP